MADNATKIATLQAILDAGASGVSVDGWCHPSVDIFPLVAPTRRESPVPPLLPNPPKAGRQEGRIVLAVSDESPFHGDKSEMPWVPCGDVTTIACE